MSVDSFPEEVAEKLKWYVYRLIDPRNGETFYVGKGKGDRVFAHAYGATALGDEDAVDLKYQRIKEITAAGLKVGHVVHRHGIETEDVAYQIEAALIDAYPGVTNKVAGHGTADYGCRHVDEIVAEYSFEPLQPRESLLLISIARTYEEEDRPIYDAVRAAWKIDPHKASRFRLVLAHRRGVVLGAFRPTQWLPALKLHFPWLDEDIPGRVGFEGVPAEPEFASLYIRKRVPEQYRTKGAANPVRYVEVSADF